MADSTTLRDCTPSASSGIYRAYDSLSLQKLLFVPRSFGPSAQWLRERFRPNRFLAGRVLASPALASPALASPALASPIRAAPVLQFGRSLFCTSFSRRPFR